MAIIFPSLSWQESRETLNFQPQSQESQVNALHPHWSHDARSHTEFLSGLFLHSPPITFLRYFLQACST